MLDPWGVEVQPVTPESVTLSPHEELVLRHSDRLASYPQASLVDRSVKTLAVTVYSEFGRAQPSVYCQHCQDNG